MIFFDRFLKLVINKGKDVHQVSGEQVTFEASLFLSDSQYKKFCNLLNHDNTMDPAGSTVLNLGDTAIYWVHIPTMLPREGFPFCVLKGNTLRIRLRLRNAIAATAFGTLDLDDIYLCLNCFKISQSEVP